MRRSLRELDSRFADWIATRLMGLENCGEMWMSRRLLRALTFGLFVLLLQGAAGASDTGPGSRLASLVASASAQGFRVSLSASGFLVVERLADTGGPVAQAVLAPQDRRSFASMPYPGDTALGIPGIVAAGGGPSLPAYPLYVEASDSQPEAGFSDATGTYRLEATADEPDVAAHSIVQPQGGGQIVTRSIGSARVQTDGQETKAVAESVNEAVSVADGAVRVSSVRSRSTTTWRNGDERPSSKTELVVEGGRAGNLDFAYGPDGLILGSSPRALPLAEGLAVLNESLEPVGAHLDIVRAVEIAGGASAEVLEVLISRGLPSGGRGDLRVRLGGATTALTAGTSENTVNTGPVEELPLPKESPVGDPIPPSASDVPSTSLPTPSIATRPGADLVSTGTPAIIRAPVEPRQPVATGPPEAPADDAPPTSATIAEASDLAPRRVDMRLGYVVLGASGGLMLLGSSVWRGRGRLQP